MFWAFLLACQSPSSSSHGWRLEGEDAIYEDDVACLKLSATLVAQGDWSLDFSVDAEGLTPTLSTTTGGQLQGLMLSGPLSLAGSTPLRWWRQGYQSWSWSGVSELAALELDDDGIPLAGGDTDSLSPASETPATSWWAGLLGRPNGPSLHIGTLTAPDLKFYVATDGKTLSAIWGHRGESLTVPAGGQIQLPALALQTGDDPQKLWEDWAEAVLVKTPARPLPERPPVGWNDWYARYGSVSLADIQQTIDDLAQNDARLQKLDLIQIDDGWERAWGDWQANDRFPGGMQAATGMIHDAGYRAGLWMAPFYVSIEAPIYQEHGDWWVRDNAGQTLLHGQLAIIDVSQPEAAAWMQAQVRAQVDAGFSYLKLDFLYAGAVEGQRAQAMTGMQAYAEGLRLLREAAGPETEILACGAPLLPSVGFPEYWRSGADIAYSLAPDPDPAFIRWQARSTAARAWANGRFWYNDADPALLRAPLSDAEARGAIAGMAASGGLWFLGDMLGDISAERLAWALDPDLADLPGQFPVPHDPLSYVSGFDASPLIERAQPDDQVPEIWELGDATILLNFTASALTLDAPDTDVWSGAGPGPLELAPGEGTLRRP